MSASSVVWGPSAENTTVGQKMVPMFFIFFIFLFFEIFSLAMISNASIKVESPGTQKHSRKGFTALSLFVVKYLLEMSRKVIDTIF